MLGGSVEDFGEVVEGEGRRFLRINIWRPPNGGNFPL